LTAGWHNLAMLNFAIDPHVLEPYVPAGTELDFFNGQTYVSIVGFQFTNATALGIRLPFHSHFEEVNLRFYVVRPTPDGLRRGVVFLREICPMRLVSLVARWYYNEKYVTMPMRHEVSAWRVQYQWWHGQRWNGVSVDLQGTPQLPFVGSEEE